MTEKVHILRPFLVVGERKLVVSTDIIDGRAKNHVDYGGVMATRL